LKKTVVWVKSYFLGKKAIFGNRTGVEGIDDYKTGAEA